MMARRKGRFITLSGIDGAGKTSLAASLARLMTLRGNRSLLHSEPTMPIDFSQSPEAIYKALLRDRTTHADAIKYILARGDSVICDRYMFDTFAYQGAQGINLDRIINDHAGMPLPDVAMFLMRPIKTCHKFVDGRGNGEFFDEEYLSRVADLYELCPSRWPFKGKSAAGLIPDLHDLAGLITICEEVLRWTLPRALILRGG